jgi:hypothetical protein
MNKIGEIEMEINDVNEEFARIRSGLSGVKTASFLDYRNRKRKRFAFSSALVILVVGFLVVSPLSKAPTIQSAWSAEPESISATDKAAAEKRCFNEIQSSGSLIGSTILDYRSGIGFLRLDVSGEYWNCGFSTLDDSVSVTKWTEGISSPGKLIKTSGEINPDFTLNLSSNSFNTGVKDFPIANFISGTTPTGVASVKVSVAGLPEGTATVSDGIFGIWIPSEGDAEVKFISSDGNALETLKVKSAK